MAHLAARRRHLARVEHGRKLRPDVRTQVVTQADLEALNATLEAIDRSESMFRDLEAACREKGDTQRVQACYVARLRLGEARRIVEHAFR